MRRHAVSNVEEAVELALKLREAGQYNWFRGQLQASWMPSSSLERALDRGESHEILQQRILRFQHWAESEPSLKYLADAANRDQLFAVLQHYGVPTCYIDFSTDPGIAGFFASDCEVPPPPGTISTILCLSTADIRAFYDTHIDSAYGRGAETPQIDLVSVDVNNLWRLQAQSGRFVFANHKWYHFYDLDRIDFPWTGYPSFPPRDRIYPVHRSPLEVLLSNYFEEERRQIGRQKFLQEQRGRAAAGRPTIRHMTLHSDGYDQRVFPSPPQELDSWGEVNLKLWLETPAEIFQEAVGIRQTITMRTNAPAPLPSVQLAYGLSAAMRQDVALRRRAVHWDLQGLPNSVDRDRLELLVRELWNGMRILPYEDEDIAAACGALLEMCVQPDCMSSDGSRILAAFRAWCPDAMEVEFGGDRDSGSRGYCSATRLHEVISPIWISALPPGRAVDSAVPALQACHLPRRMFDFQTFAKLFARELIPSQLALGRAVIHFNPARLTAFGLP